MKEKLKYNFLHTIPLHYFKSYKCFAQDCHFFCNTVCSILEQNKNIASIRLFSAYITSWLAFSVEVKGIILNSRQGCGHRLGPRTRTRHFITDADSLKNFDESASMVFISIKRAYLELCVIFVYFSPTLF